MLMLMMLYTWNTHGNYHSNSTQTFQCVHFCVTVNNDTIAKTQHTVRWVPESVNNLH